MAAVTAAIIAAVGGLGGAALSAYGGKKPKKQAQIDKKNPLYNAVLAEALTNLGVPLPPGLIESGSPLARLGSIKPKNDLEIASIIKDGIAAGLTDAEIAKQVEQVGLKTTAKGNIKKSLFYDKAGNLKGKLAKSGVTSLEQLIGEQRKFLDYSGKLSSSTADTQAKVAAGRKSATEAIAGIQGDFVAPTREDILKQSSIVEEAYRGQIARERGDQEAALLEQANAMNINPGARLGRLDEWQAQRNLEAQPEGLARALQLLSGQQGLQANALATLQGSLGQASGQGMNMLGLQNTLGQQAAAQSLALANYSQNQANTMGAGLANAAYSASQIPLLQQLLEGGQRAGGPGDAQNALDYYGQTRQIA